MRAGLRRALLCVVASLSATSALSETTTSFPEGVASKATADGLILVEDGRPLYRLDLDRVAKRRRLPSNSGGLCTGACGQLWQPVPAPASGAVGGDWTVTQRADGVRQLTYKGDPLYRFMGKSLAEAADLRVFPPYLSSYSAKPARLVDGVPVSDIYWHEATYQPPAPQPPKPGGIGLKWIGSGYVFTADDGQTLYVSTDPAGCGQSCIGMALLPAPLAARAVGPWRPVQGADGGRHWSYSDRDVYRGATNEPPGSAWLALSPQTRGS